jgi:hypothetical protein
MNDETKNNEAGGMIIKIDEGKIRDHLDDVVRDAVEETLNKLLEAEADRCSKRSTSRKTLKRREAKPRRS